MTKRVISLLLILVMLTGLLPVFARAEEKEAAVDTGDLSVEGTNGFGTLLAGDIAQEQANLEEQETPGYTLTDLEITGNTATVTYDSLEEATVVVALYTEDGMQLLSSGKTTVNPEETTATVTIEGEMPQYFMASAYLLDSYDMSPLCPAYDTPMYTQEMQELLASTAEDYDADRVLQLEEGTETNFAVYAETTKVIEQEEGINTVTTADDETNTYVIENADESMTSLQTGDVFAYPYGEDEILILKVATITVDGTTVTITGGELEMEEAFEYAKIETVMDTEGAQVDMTSADEGASYLGKTTELPEARSVNGSISQETAAQFEYSAYDNGKFSFKGSVKFYTKVSLEYYITRSYQRLSFRLDFGSEIEIGAELKVLDGEGINLEGKLGTLVFPVVPGVSVKFTPSLVAEFAVTITFKFTFETTIGFGFEHDESGFEFLNLCTTPKTTANLEVQGKLFIGLKLAPALDILGGLLAEAEVAGELGFEFTGTVVAASTEQWSDQRHDCTGCVDGSVAAKLKITPSVQFLKIKGLKFSVELVNCTWKLFDFYLCPQHLEMGIGKCPRTAYRVTISVTDDDGAAVPGASVTSDTGDQLGITNGNGALTVYLSAGSHRLSADIDGETVTKKVSVSGAGVIGISATAPGPNILGSITEADRSELEILSDGTVTASGTCGENVTWTLYSSGTMYIAGTGAMTGYAYSDEVPWYPYGLAITKVVIEDGVTEIGHFAFCDCPFLTAVSIPDSVTGIGESAFYACTRLSAVNIPDSVTSIGYWAFGDCDSLTAVSIPASVTSIETLAFGGCDKLTSITVAADNPAYSSDSTGVLLNKDKTTLVQALGSFTSYTVPEGVTCIGNAAFYGCTSLTAVYIPAGVTSIENSAFGECGSLTDVYYEGTQTQWNAISIERGNENLDYDATIHYNSSVTAVTAACGSISGSTGSQLVSAEAVFGGIYNTEVTDTCTVKTADFTDLAPGKEYVLLAMVSLDVEEPLSADNLLFVDQAVSTQDGTLSFRYVQRVDAPVSYVMACGASTRDLAEAEIVFPEMTANGEPQVVRPTVVYDGKTLIEGQDYVIAGDADFTGAGEYTCYIRGIYSYTGLVACPYTVLGTGVRVSGSVTTGADGDCEVQLLEDGVVAAATTVSGKTGTYSIEDVAPGVYTLRISKLNHASREYELTVGNESVSLDLKLHLLGDISGDGRVNVGDVARIYAYVRKTGSLSEYELLCADVSGDGRVNVGDTSRMYAHVKKTSSLW